jgi:AraC-like DNA-binding protein
LKEKSKNANVTSTKLAYGSGFYDQAHFINTFLKFIGKAPSFFFEDMKAEADGNYIIDPLV